VQPIPPTFYKTSTYETREGGMRLHVTGHEWGITDSRGVWGGEDFMATEDDLLAMDGGREALERYRQGDRAAFIDDVAFRMEGVEAEEAEMERTRNERVRAVGFKTFQREQAQELMAMGWSQEGLRPLLEGARRRHVAQRRLHSV